MRKFHLIVPALLTAGIVAAGWRPEPDPSGFFSFGSEESFSADADSYVKTLIFRAPARRPSSNTPIEIAAAFTCELDPGAPAELVFRYRDEYAAQANAGYYKLAVRGGGRELWSEDAACDNDREYRVKLPIAAYRAGRAELVFSLAGLRQVTNYPLNARFDAIGVVQHGRYKSLLDRVPPAANFVSVPDTPQVPAMPPRLTDWMRDLVAVQAWFQSDYNLMKRYDRYLPLVAGELKMNAICVRPPAVFNAMHHNKKIAPGHSTVPPAEFCESEAEFAAMLKAYRDAGFKIIMYTGIPHLGHTAEWNTGELQQQHPEWLQVGPGGEKVFAFGNFNFCPNTPALDYAIKYSNGLVEKYGVDALMFDNNFYQMPGKTADGRTVESCYCPTCRRKFREYVLKNYGDVLESGFGVKPENIAIPTGPGPLKMLWIDWRNRCWAEAMEKVRSRIKVPVFANTEFMWRNWELGVDRIYRHEDAVFSESNYLGNLPEKYCLGNAFAPDRPHFSYLVPFVVSGEQYWKLKSPGDVAELVGTTLLYNLNLWLMFHGWDPALGYPEPIGDANRPSQEMIKRYFAFRNQHRDWFLQMRPIPEMGVVTSSRNRMAGAGMNFSLGLSRMIRNGFAVDAIHDLTLADADLTPYRFILADRYEYMSDQEADHLIDFVKRGGVLYASPDSGRRDQFGRIRPESALASRYAAIKSSAAGKLEFYRDVTALTERLMASKAAKWRSRSFMVVSKPYRLPDGTVLIQGMVQQKKYMRRDFELPEALRGVKSVRLHTPHRNGPLELAVRDNVVSIPEDIWYFILEVKP